MTVTQRRPGNRSDSCPMQVTGPSSHWCLHKWIATRAEDRQCFSNWLGLPNTFTHVRYGQLM